MSKEQWIRDFQEIEAMYFGGEINFSGACIRLGDLGMSAVDAAEKCNEWKRDLDKQNLQSEIYQDRRRLNEIIDRAFDRHMTERMERLHEGRKIKMLIDVMGYDPADAAANLIDVLDPKDVEKVENDMFNFEPADGQYLR